MNAELLQQALDRWGRVPQMLMAVEECSELSKTLLHFIRGRVQPAEVAGEVADVLIMGQQMRLIFGEELVDRAVAFKMDRLRERLGMEAIPSPGLTPPRPAGCPSCAQAEAEVDRLKAALDLEARARKVAADGLADAKADLDELVALLERCISRDCRFIPEEDVAAARAALARFRPSVYPAIPAEDLVEALDDDPSTTLERVQ